MGFFDMGMLRILVVTMAVAALATGCTRDSVPEVTPTPGQVQPAGNLDDQEEVDSLAMFIEVTQDFEKIPEDEDNGYVSLAARSSELQDESFNLTSKEEREHFDKVVLPLFEEIASKPIFASTQRLLAGRAQVDYRELRRLVQAVNDRAAQAWEAGDRAQAVKLFGWPLALAHSMQARPETVSVNLFSYSYMGSSLDLLQEWLTLSNPNVEDLERIAEQLRKFRPDHDHLVRTITVDFAQLHNSLGEESVRGNLGVAFSGEELLEAWREELLGLHQRGLELYKKPLMEKEAFNDSIRKASPQLQGLIIDYPEVLTMQRRWYTYYLAMELAVAIELQAQKQKSETVDPGRVATELFAEDEPATFGLNSYLELKAGSEPGRFTLVGRKEVFKLISPDEELLFYKR